MSTADILGVVAVVAALIGIAATAVYGRRALNPPKRLILWNSGATPLIARGHAQYSSSIEVRVRGNKVDNPYLCELTIENAGRQDIDSSAFDQARPIKFTVRERRIATFIEPDNNPPGLQVDGNSILIGPELLRSKIKMDYLICHGRSTNS